MPHASLSKGRVDPQLTNVLLAYSNQDFVADRIFPTVGNLKDETGKIPSMGNEGLRTYSSKREIWDESEHKIGFTIDNTKTYQIDFYDLSTYLPYRFLEGLQSPFDGKSEASRVLLDSLMLQREKAVAEAITSTAIMTNNVTLATTDLWTDLDDSDPLGDIETAKTSVYSKIGREANRIMIGRKALVAFKQHPKVLEMLKYTGVPTESRIIQFLKDEFGFTDVVVGKTIEIATKEGQTETTSILAWENDVVVYYAPAAPSLFTPSLGYNFKIAGKDRAVREMPHPNGKGINVETEMAYQDKVIDVNAGYLIKNAVD